MTAVMLAVAVMCGTLMGSYQEAQASGIVAGGAIVGTLEEILLSFGIFLLPSSMADSAQNSDWWYSEDGNAALKPYYDDLASEYEKERFKVINGGGGDPQPSPTPVPEQKPEIQPTPVPEVKPGDIPTFDELVAPALAGGAISWASGAWDTMAKAVGNLWDSLIYNHDKINGYTIDNFDQLYADSLGMFQTFDGSDRYCVSFLEPNDNIIGFRIEGASSTDTKIYPIFKASYSGSKDVFMHSYYFPAKYSKKNGRYVNSGAFYYYTSYQLLFYNFNVPLYDSKNNLINLQKKEDIWVHPDLQETYQNNGKLEYPQEAPQPLQYPSAENLADLAKKLNPEINPDYSPEIAPNYVQELIKKLQQDPSVNPDPNPNPNPDPL